ncbi:MAG: hypothetical protein GEU73_07720 [Chloroflexi bacterium]|nr:hypothetical protein [Chloroflexota bacterium]
MSIPLLTTVTFGGLAGFRLPFGGATDFVFDSGTPFLGSVAGTIQDRINLVTSIGAHVGGRLPGGSGYRLGRLLTFPAQLGEFLEVGGCLWSTKLSAVTGRLLFEPCGPSVGVASDSRLVPSYLTGILTLGDPVGVRLVESPMPTQRHKLVG